MKKIAVVAVLVMALAWCGMAFAFENEPEGFRGLKWGDAPTSKMKLFREADKWTAIYRLPGEKLELGEAKLLDICYGFYVPPNNSSKRLMSVSLYFGEKSNYGKLETVCRGKFGEPTKEGFYELVWVSPVSSVLLAYMPVDKMGYLALNDQEIWQEYLDEKEKRELKEAEEDW